MTAVLYLTWQMVLDGRIIIIMYNALSAHIIHINLNMIFYTHVEHSHTETIYIRYYYKIKIK